MRSILALSFLCFAGCFAKLEPVTATITLATTTSTQDSGLLDALLPVFKQETGIEVKVVAVGSGQALQLGRRGDADVLLVHDPASELKFMDEGYGAARHPVMHNDFVLVGPKNDPAGIKGEKSIAKTFRDLARQKAAFVSRGDESGTHQKEKELWRKAEQQPESDWYIRAGAGMGAVLRMANEKRAYTLTDRGTYLAMKEKLELEILSEGDSLLRNPYAVIVVNPEKHAGVKAAEARKFAEFLRSEKARELIRTFGVSKHGQPLFFPELTGEP